MPAERQVVDWAFRQIQKTMRNQLRCVAVVRNAGCLAHADDFADRLNRSQLVIRADDRNENRVFRQTGFKNVQTQNRGRIDRNDFHPAEAIRIEL